MATICGPSNGIAAMSGARLLCKWRSFSTPSWQCKTPLQTNNNSRLRTFPQSGKIHFPWDFAMMLWDFSGVVEFWEETLFKHITYRLDGWKTHTSFQSHHWDQQHRLYKVKPLWLKTPIASHSYCCWGIKIQVIQKSNNFPDEYWWISLWDGTLPQKCFLRWPFCHRMLWISENPSSLEFTWLTTEMSLSIRTVNDNPLPTVDGRNPAPPGMYKTL